MLDENMAPLLARFPDRVEEIERRFADEPTFREICLDYLELNRMVVRLQEAPTDTAGRMLADYQAMLTEIAHELQLVMQSKWPVGHRPTTNPEDSHGDERNSATQYP
jgi:hypothetical protein